MDNEKPLSQREIALIEEYGLLKQHLEVMRILQTAMVVRLGGMVKIEHNEIDFTRKQYILTEEISSDAYTFGAKLHVRLR